MVDIVFRLIRRNTHTLRSRLVLFTALTLVLSCSALSWYFVYRQINTATDALLKSGEQLAAQLAATTLYSVAVKDSHRIQELIRTTSTLDDLAYVLVASRENVLLGALATPEFKRLAGNRISSDWLALFADRRAQVISTQTGLAPLPIRIADGHPMTESSVISTTERWIAVMFGLNRPRLFDIAVPIGRIEPAEPDPALGMPLDESNPLADRIPHISATVSGVIQVGLTDRHQQVLLRSLIEQAILITLAILTLCLAAVAYISRRMTQPLHALTIAARKVAAGDLSVSAAVLSSDEIGDLTTVFNHMTRSLQAREQDLVDLNRTLETKVERRTKDLQEANERLRELDRLKSALVSNASHELRTPLTSIRVHVRNLLDGVSGALAADQRESLERVHSNVERLHALIDDLLDLSHLHAGTKKLRRELVAVRPLIQEVLEALRYFSDMKQTRIACFMAEDLPDLVGDREQLRRIFTNLLHNAIKFTAPGGQIRVEGGRDVGETVVVSVQDSGCGIADTDRDRIFLPFFRSNDTAAQVRGTGLGLSIAKELVQLHGGAIWVESVVGSGSCFCVKLPAENNHSPQSLGTEAR